MRHIVTYIVFMLLLVSGSINNVYAQEQTDTTQTQAPAQNRAKVKLTGKVSDDQGDGIPMCLVRIEGQGGTTANMDGQYSIEFTTDDTITVVYNMMGYEQKKKVLIRPQGNLVWNVTLHDKVTDLQEVTVKEIRRQLTTTTTINTEDIKRMPSTTGNAVEEMVATQAGVSSHNEMSSQYNVRGGSFDENCVYINGVEIYRPLLVNSGQQEGLSAINSDMVESVSFSAGGFDAKYGDRMSSVLDITYHRPTKWEGSVAGSLMGATAYAGYGNKKFSFSNGLRYKSNQYMLGALQTDADYEPNFLDYQAYLSWSPSKKWNIEAIGYISKNNYKFIPHTRSTTFGTLETQYNLLVYFDGWEEDLFRTMFGAAKVTRQLGQHSNINLSYSGFTTKERVTYDIQGQYWFENGETDAPMTVATYMEHARNLLTSNTQTLKLNYELKKRNHQFLAGLGWKIEKLEESSREWESRDSSGYNIPHTGQDLVLIYNLKSINDLSSNRLEFFAQDTWRRESKLGTLSLNYGARLSHWTWNGEWLFSPRACLGYVPAGNENLVFRLATGLYYQTPFYKELRDTTTLSGGNTVVELNRNIKSQRSFQLLTGMEYKFRVGDRPFKFSAEAYYKAQSNLNPYNVDNVKVVYYGNNCANGYVVGADFKIYGEFVPGTDSWVSFGLMKAQMNLNGKSIPQPTDQRWNLNMFFTDFFPGSTRWKMSLKASFADGLPFGPPHTGLEKHAFRDRVYKRIDIGMNYRALNNEKRQHRGNPIRNIWLGLDCFNIFDFKNVSSHYWVNDVSGHQYAVPNYLTGRMINGRVLVEF